MDELTDDEIDACRRIGRDEANRRTTIGLAEFDALCEQAKEANRLRTLVRRIVIYASDVGDRPRWWVRSIEEGHFDKLSSTVVLHMGKRPDDAEFAIVDG